jgi:hypothetical protein
MTKIKLEMLFTLLFAILVFLSCGTSYDARTYEYIPRTEGEYRTGYNRKTLSIKNDSIITIAILYGGIGKSQSIKYRIRDNRLIVDSLDVKGYFVNDFFDEFGTLFLYYKDSIVSEKNNDLYFSQKYLNEINKRLNRSSYIYLILDNDKKYKVKQGPDLRRIKISSYDNMIELDKDEARKLYGIDKKYRTYKFIKKE